MVPPTYAARAYEAAELFESMMREYPELLNEDTPQRVFDYPGCEPLRKLDLSLAQATWAFYEAKRRVREKG